MRLSIPRLGVKYARKPHTGASLFRKMADVPSLMTKDYAALLQQSARGICAIYVVSIQGITEYITAAMRAVSDSVVRRLQG